MDLNCDLGESFGRYTLGEDAALMPLITSVNVACGFHAGDALTMQRTVRLAGLHGVALGAHPGWLDLQGFGRRTMQVSAEETEAFVLYQLGALAAFAQAEGVTLRHVKPHGALYNQAAHDPQLAAAVARAVQRFDSRLILVGLAGSHLPAAGAALGLRVAHEAFPDRGYNPDGSLMARHLPGALLHSAAAVAAHAVTLATEGIRIGGRALLPDTLCLHGDHAGAAENAQQVRAALMQAGVPIAPIA
ncbi:MAG: 5-oxoprolinase subunit PxpA [Anaerolineales bacterium]